MSASSSIPALSKHAIPRTHFFTSARTLSLEAKSAHTLPSRDVLSWGKLAGVASVGLCLSILAAPMIFCEPAVARTSPYPISQPSPSAPFQSPEGLPPPPSSNVNYLELTFGTAAGVCAGVFVKKGAKAVAFVLGGVFVLLQYLGSLSLVRVDWVRASSRFENLFYRTDASGQRRAPTVGSLFRWIIDFLTADFQERASFVAGFALGLRIG
ncbi:hypothetical protein WOLCODRAFT_64834 [Wolfiporia cocos MD-104 SS10]|uniref:FUN14-domain-containing protein n=1 Tax=Wolfiporia cocos (strain MD-104) TaxID=742152 RepID=A0A2H3JH60_WOLCO|nr:hypothetical protein WOLCODRAFT_64834 [Wolfiporia cocos MD-104 SS10]